MKAVLSLLVVAMTGTVFAQSPVSFSHEPAGCISAECGRVVTTARVESSVPLKSVRVRFADAAGSIFYSEMIHSGDWNFYAVLPAVLPGTGSVSYTIVAIAEDGMEIEGPSHAIPVTEDCAPTALTAEQTAYAMNAAIGLTSRAQSGTPAGFSCVGLVKTISAGDVLEDNVGCEAVRLAKTDPCMFVPGAGEQMAEGLSGRQAAVYTAAGLAVGVGGAVLWDRSSQPSEPVSRSRP